jgi:hypothetical protein
MEEQLTGIREDISELKTGHKEMIDLMRNNAVLEEKLIHSNAKHDEGRKVLHKRLDIFAKVAFWLGTTVVTGMVGIIWTLLDRLLK